jgi:hypothetical protein
MEFHCKELAIEIPHHMLILLWRSYTQKQIDLEAINLDWFKKERYIKYKNQRTIFLSINNFGPIDFNAIMNLSDPRYHNSRSNAQMIL